MLAVYLDRWKRRTGRRVPTAVAIRGLLRIALIHCGCRDTGKNVSRETRRRAGKMQQIDLFGGLEYRDSYVSDTT
jgi:hypothetical protein